MKAPPLILLAALLWASAAGATAAPGAEREALDYHSDVTVQKDGLVRVVETIQMRFVRRRHGIYRDIPTIYRGPWFSRHTVALEVLAVTRDGGPSPFHTARAPNGVRIYVGDENVELQPGTHTYGITYTLDRQLGFFEGHDELNWNVTGQGWDCPILTASATVNLPAPVAAEDLKLKAFTGKQSQRGTDYRSEMDEQGRPVFTTTRGLQPGEGLTVVVGWPKGVVAAPTADQRFAYFLRDNLGPLIGALGLVAVVTYYLGAWVAVGRDPARGVIIPLFEPPEGLSPAAARYLMRMGYDGKCFTAAVISLAVKGYVTIENEGDDYTITRTGKDTRGLPAEEKGALSKLIRSSTGSIELERKNHGRIGKAIEALKSALRLALAKRHFHTNRGYLVPGLLLTAVSLLAAGLLSPSGEPMLFAFMCVWLGGWSLGVTALLVMAAAAWRSALASPGCTTGMGAALGITLFSIPFLIGEAVGIGAFISASSVWMLPLLGAAAMANVLFYLLIRAPTRSGRALMDKLEGFRMYLSAAEQDYLNFRHPPTRTPELFEKYLPYALALDVENEWAEQFAGVLQDAATGEMTHMPGWYSGAAWATVGAAGLASSLGGSLTGAISSAATAPGSSSGFGGGGGGAGGGGGGGGGGAW